MILWKGLSRIRFNWRLIVVIAVALVVLTVVVLTVSVPGLKWRVRVFSLKAQGRLSDLSWSELFHWVRPGSPVYLEPLLETKSPFRSIRNPYVAKEHVAEGRVTFRSRCAGCHGVEGEGATGPRLVERRFSRGDSDWALYRTISRGLPGTAMPPVKLPEKSIWQIVAFVQSLNSSSEQHQERRQHSRGDIVSFSPVTFEQLVNAESQSSNWLTYSGSYEGRRYSMLKQINRENLQNLKLLWAFQMPTDQKVVETTPLVVDGIMFLTEPPNNVLALDAETGRLLWSYQRELPDRIPLCCGRVNRGLAILGDKVYMGTLDARLVALNARNGKVVWEVEVEDYSKGYSITAAPLAVKDMIITGVAGGEYGIRGFLDAYDAETGRRKWRFYTVPTSEHQGHDTWSEGWQTGGCPTWLTGSFDPRLNTIFWGVGNPSPVYESKVRKGDNLYSNSVIALDADTGKLRWYFQSTPQDDHDWDAVQIPVLADLKFNGMQRKLMLWANRNAFYYVLDRSTGEFLLAQAFARQTWAERIDERGRPVRRPGTSPSPAGTLVYPGVAGATNWWSPAFSQLTGYLYVPVWERPSVFFSGPVHFEPSEIYLGSASQYDPGDPGYTAIRALDALTGNRRWEYRPHRTHSSGLAGALATAGGLVFGGDNELFFALDAHTGKELWRINTGADILAAPITYMCQRRQQVTIAAGRAVLTFGF